MSPRRVNLALLMLTSIALASGVAAFATGTGAARAATVVHGVAGIALVLLTRAKTAISLRGVRRRQRGWTLSILLAALIAIAIATGFAHSLFGVRMVGPLTIMQLHVGSALAATPLLAIHLWKRPARLRRTDLERRRLIETSAGAGLAIAVFAAIEGAARVTGIPGASRRATGSHERGSFSPTEMPTTIWINDRTPALDPALYRLRVRTPVSEQQLTLDDLGRRSRPVVATLDCTSGWYSSQEWSCVALADLADPGLGSSILVTSATGYRRRFPSGDAAVLYLATDVGSRPLSRGHGAPVRLVAPGRRGFWWVKWVDSVEVSHRPAWWQSPFPLS